MLRQLQDTEEKIFMNRIENTFKNKKAFIPFITAGYPNLKKTEDYIGEMVSAGADLIEIGIPFSDPVAEGPVIQKSSKKALEEGTNLDNIFELVKNVRKRVAIPLVFMTYINPIFKYGYDKFFEQCAKTGIDGIIVPDLPFEEKDEIFNSSYFSGKDRRNSKISRRFFVCCFFDGSHRCQGRNKNRLTINFEIGKKSNKCSRLCRIRYSFS